MEQFQSLYEKVNRFWKDSPLVKTVELKAGVKAGIFLTFVVGLVFVLVFLGVAADLITEIIGMFYPIYMSFKAIETKETDDDKLWLTYWVAYAGFKVVDDFALIFSYWIPFYYPIKLIILIWLFSPSTKGAVQLYDGFIRGFLLNHQNQIDSGIQKFSDVSENTSQFVKDEVMKRKVEPNSHKSF